MNETPSDSSQPSDSSLPIDAPLPQRIAQAVDRFGEAAFAQRAIGLLEGRNEGEEVLLYVGGRHAQGLLDGAPALYWPELWGARALLHVWDDSAVPAVIRGVDNRAWRVREMCLKVCAERGIGDESAITRRTTDENPRVRAAAARALAKVGTAASEESLRRMLRDPDKDVRRAVGESLKELAARLA